MSDAGRELLSSVSLRQVDVKIPETSWSFSIQMPADFDVLLDHAERDLEQNLPYWAELWPSGIAMAAFIYKEQAAVRGVRAVELGCGLGVTAIAAMRSGLRLTATDYSNEALALCAANCVANETPVPTLLQLNWRKPNADYFNHTEEGIQLLIAADVLYEERDVAPLLELVEMTLPDEGELWLAEPGRRPAQRFMEAIRSRGWLSEDKTYMGSWPDPDDNRKGVIVTVHRIARPGNPG